MSEFINNREHRQTKLKELIRRLHDGATVEDVKEEFDKLTIGVTATEIAEMEQALVNEGMPVEDIQRLCDVHASVFKGSIEEIHSEDGFEIADFDEGHPVHTFKKENRLIEGLLENEVLRFLSDYTESKKSDDSLKRLSQSIDKLATIDRHYSRKENILFPYMEKYNMTAPPQVMWGVDDEIREKIKVIQGHLKEAVKLPVLNQQVRELVGQVNEMIFKEEEIMFPMVLDTFSHGEWVEIEKASADIGFTLVHAVKRWLPKSGDSVEATDDKDNSANVSNGSLNINGAIPFDAGSLTPEEINSILNTLPLDMTFVDADDKVKYFTQGKERIFDRPKTIIGREVKNCHPPKSVHIVEQIVEDLKSGKKDNEDFWIKMGKVFVYIRYFAVRNKKGDFLGTLEITQNIKPITELEGEKRLRDEEAK